MQIDSYQKGEPCHIPHFSPILFSEHPTEIGVSLPVTQNHFYVLVGIFPIGKKISGLFYHFKNSKLNEIFFLKTLKQNLDKPLNLGFLNTENIRQRGIN